LLRVTVGDHGWDTSDWPARWLRRERVGAVWRRASLASGLPGR